MFHVPMQYCSLQHQILLSSPDASIAEHHFHFGPAASFFPELLVAVLCSSPVACWTHSDLGGLICQCHIFLSFYTVCGVLTSQQVYWGGLPFPPPVNHILSELSSMTCPSLVALHGMVRSIIELCKPLHHNKAVIQGILCLVC